MTREHAHPATNRRRGARRGVKAEHSFGMLVMNVAVLRAGKLVPIPNPRDLHLVMEEIDKEKPTFVPGVPRFFNAINESPLVGKFDLRSVKACISGAAPLPTAVAERFGKARALIDKNLAPARVQHLNQIAHLAPHALR